MTWRGRTTLLALALLVTMILFCAMLSGARRSPRIPAGQANARELLEALEEVERMLESREIELEDVEDIVRGICEHYPELSDLEVCNGSRN